MSKRKSKAVKSSDGPEEEKQEPLKCAGCKRGFDTARGLQVHQRTCQPNKNLVIGPATSSSGHEAQVKSSTQSVEADSEGTPAKVPRKGLACSHCGKNFTNKGWLTRHMKSCELVPEPAANTSSSSRASKSYAKHVARIRGSRYEGSRT